MFGKMTDSCLQPPSGAGDNFGGGAIQHNASGFLNVKRILLGFLCIYKYKFQLYIYI